MTATLVLIAAAVAILSGAHGFYARTSGDARLSALLAVLSSAIGLTAAGLALAGDGARMAFAWPGVPGGEVLLEVDRLSATFLVPLFVVSALGAIYATGYWSDRERPDSAPRVRLFYGVLTGALALVFVARNGVLFLAAWETMALSGYVLVTTEHRDPPTRAAGWLYLAATHTGTLLLFGLFALLHSATGTLSMSAIPAGIAGSPIGWAIFLLALAGFGIKAGLMPLHVWLPPAHAAAPSHVSALMSGVLIKTGVYGIARVTLLFPDPPVHWGTTVLVLGTISAVLGVAFALGQHDLKRLLAYHSIENVGIIVMALGLGLLGRSLAVSEWVVLGYSAALLHVVNHALFKSLLFYGAGAAIHASGTRAMDRMGGLARRMPITATAFALGAVAICGLPPLNGFVSELLLYLGLAGAFTSTGALWAGFAMPALALVGALALACFVKAFGVVFLGEPRTPMPHVHEAPWSMLAPMGIAAALCVAIGLGSPLIVPLLVPIAPHGLGDASHLLAPLAPVSVVGAGLLLALALAAALLVRARSEVASAGTWDCGYAAPSARMQYTASSFADPIVRMFALALLPRRHVPTMKRIFARTELYESHVPDTVLDRVLVPLFRGAAVVSSLARRLQPKYLPLYLLYIAVALLVLLSRV